MPQKQIRSCMRIPLDSISDEEKIKVRKMDGRTIVIDSEEPCLTCGRHKRLKYAQHIDGKLFLIEECLYCLVKNGNGATEGTLTAANRATT